MGDGMTSNTTSNHAPHLPKGVALSRTPGLFTIYK